jgi:hypothetical protein
MILKRLEQLSPEREDWGKYKFKQPFPPSNQTSDELYENFPNFSNAGIGRGRSSKGWGQGESWKEERERRGKVERMRKWSKKSFLSRL